MNESAVVLTANGLCKRFGANTVVRSFSLECTQGEVVLLLGANGAGKSTLLRTLAGLVRQDSGSVELLPGSRVGFAAHHSFLYSKLSVLENVRLYSRLLGVSEVACKKLLSRWRLDDFLDTTVANLSKGTQAKVSLVRALLAEPVLLLLDEPSSNLDEASVGVLAQEIEAQRARGVAIIATHDVSRLKALATRVVVVDRGSCIADSGANASVEARDDVIARYYEANR